uniref:Uncharacterized protein n=1 Tax=Lepeophtheirus salmonis TaxID=72036 RepID=A0A0K2UA11_LEPSM
MLLRTILFIYSRTDLSLIYNCIFVIFLDVSISLFSSLVNESSLSLSFNPHFIFNIIFFSAFFGIRV